MVTSYATTPASHRMDDRHRAAGGIDSELRRRGELEREVVVSRPASRCPAYAVMAMRIAGTGARACAAEVRPTLSWFIPAGASMGHSRASSQESRELGSNPRGMPLPVRDVHGHMCGTRGRGAAPRWRRTMGTNTGEHATASMPSSGLADAARRLIEATERRDFEAEQAAMESLRAELTRIDTATGADADGEDLLSTLRITRNTDRRSGGGGAGGADDGSGAPSRAMASKRWCSRSTPNASRTNWARAASASSGSERSALTRPSPTSTAAGTSLPPHPWPHAW